MTFKEKGFDKIETIGGQNPLYNQFESYNRIKKVKSNSKQVEYIQNKYGYKEIPINFNDIKLKGS